MAGNERRVLSMMLFDVQLDFVLAFTLEPAERAQYWFGHIAELRALRCSLLLDSILDRRQSAHFKSMLTSLDGECVC